MKTYKTARGLKNAIIKLLGAESVALNEGKMSEGWMMFPSKVRDTYRVIMIDVNGYPQKFVPYEDNPDFPEWSMELSREVESVVGTTSMFNYEVVYVDITLEVSK